MKKGFLAYQLPNKKIQTYTGTWHLCRLEKLPENVFFVTDFTNDKTYYFEKEAPLVEEQYQHTISSNENLPTVLNKEKYLEQLNAFQKGFESNGLTKAIFSRIKLVEKNNANPYSIFKLLCEEYKKEALVYHISDSKFGIWMGATPEVLIRGDKDMLYSMALAGTKYEISKPWTNKEIEEQAIVSSYMKKIIETHSPSYFDKSKTTTIKYGAVFHLVTNFKFQIHENKWNSLINVLHPTPAVCGFPKQKAMNYILKNETHNRELYTGIIGFKGSDSIDIYVNLRCMQLFPNHYALYLGGGITKDSIPNDEWIETENKAKTLLNVIEKK